MRLRRPAHGLRRPPRQTPDLGRTQRPGEAGRIPYPQEQPEHRWPPRPRPWTPGESEANVASTRLATSRASGARGLGSISPLFVGQWSLIELIPVQSSLRHETVHEYFEALVEAAFQQVHHLVDEHVLQARGWFLCQLQVEPDAAVPDVATTPASLPPSAFGVVPSYSPRSSRAHSLTRRVQAGRPEVKPCSTKRVSDPPDTFAGARKALSGISA